MHTLDNDAVNLGDSVFGVGYGVGRVVELLTEDKFRVQFALTGRTITYESTGFMARASARSLFWHDPVIVPPAKDETFWHALRASVQALATALRPLL